MLLVRPWTPPTAVIAVVLAGCGGRAGSRTCDYLTSEAGSAQRFSLVVTLPDGTLQSCVGPLTPDGGVGQPTTFSGEVSGWITETAGTTFSLDTCAPGTGCTPDVSRFSIAAPNLTLALPTGRQVTATWVISLSSFSCRQELVIRDGAPAAMPPGMSSPLWLGAADSTFIPTLALPFAVVPEALHCNPSSAAIHPCGGSTPPDDYAFVFTPASGEPSLTLATGTTGTLAFTTASGSLQHLTVRNLRSYQTTLCDDYWNWGWLAAAHAGADGDPQ